MNALNIFIALLTGGMAFYGLYFLLEVIIVHKKFNDKHFYFAICCIIMPFYFISQIFLSLPLSDTQHLLFHKLKWLGIIISLPLILMTVYTCFFPNARKVIPYITFITTPLFLYFLSGNNFISLPIRTIEINNFFIKYNYHLGTQGIVYFIFGSEMFLAIIISLIYFSFSKKKPKRIAFVIILMCSVIISFHDIAVGAGRLNNIMITDLVTISSFSFIFLDFILENRKIHLSVVDLSKNLEKEKEEAIRRLRITEIYTRRSLVESIEKGDDPTKYPPQNIYIATLFSDIRDFTGISEGMPPLGVVGMLNSYFDSMNATIIKYKGEIDKLMGDCIMALFKKPDDALKAAIEMRYELEKFNTSPQPSPKERESEFPPLRGGSGWGKTINNGIGLNYGEVIMGNIGSESKMDYTVVGDIVNTASRLEALTKYYEVHIIISEEFMNQLNKPSEGSEPSEGYKIRFLDEVLVKGKSNPMKIYEVFDFEPPEIIEMKERNVQPLAEAFVCYQAGEFLQAIQIYEQVEQVSLLVNNEDKPVGQASLLVNNEDKIIEHGQSGMIDLPSNDPVLPFFISRCRKLQEQKEAGLLKDWSGVFEFMDK